MTKTLWDCEETLVSMGFDVPSWIEQDITGNDIAAIVQGGCASGAYMPAVTYHTALETMSRHGDEIFDYIESGCGELPTAPDPLSWAGLACYYVSVAVELFAAGIESEVEDYLNTQDEDAAGPSEDYTADPA
jgi:hypothetical protein